MRSRLISRLFLPSALLIAAFSQFAQGAVPSRIANINNDSRASLRGTISNRARRATDLGAAPSDRELTSLTLFFNMTTAQQADLDQLLAAQTTPGSPSYHQWLTPEQFGARFGISGSDLTKVMNWLTSQGFTVTDTARSSTFIKFMGTVAQTQKAFGTTIHAVAVDGEQHISNLTDPILPSAVAGVVTSITGLNDFRMKPHSHRQNVTVDPSKPLNTQTINGVVYHFIAPGDLYTIYDFPAYSATAGAGITIAVMGQTDLTQNSTLPDANVTAFRTAAGLPAINLKLLLAGTDPGIKSADIDEAHLDVEWSGAAAPGAQILYVYGNDAFGDSLAYAVQNAVAPIVTISYGGCESDFNSTLTNAGQSELAAYNNILKEANAQGMTVINSSGDSGATDCDTSGLASAGLNVDFPSSSPYVTSAGGTMFSDDVNTPGKYWNGNNGANGGSALSYIPEQPWNETTATGGLTDGGAGGGGASAFFSKPSWQMGTGAGATPNDSSRDVPDISMNAASGHDGYFVCTSGSSTQDLPCTNGGFLDSTGNPNVFGGTSFVAPTLAGILALVEQHLGVGGSAATGLGNINNVLYGLANGPTYSSIFHDITSGNNAVACSQGTPNCPNGGSIGFNAGTGYDQATGLGSVDVAKLIAGWSSAIPTGVGGRTSQGGISVTTLTTSASALCGVSGNLTLNVLVAGFNSTTTPTGTVQFFIDGTAAGTPQPLANGSVTGYSLSMASYSGGPSISAAYSGDSNFAGSKSPLLASDGSVASVDIVSTTKPDFSVTPCSGAVTVNPGATSTGVAFTVTPVNGFTGSVKMTATNNNNMTGTPSFTVTPVNITSSSGAATSFVVVASQPKTTAALKTGTPAGLSWRPSRKTPWYAAGSSATLAGLLLFIFPRRRRWTALLAAVLSIAAFTAVGCSSSTSTVGAPSGGTPSSTVTPATAGTYTFTITGVGPGGLVHSALVTVTVP